MALTLNGRTTGAAARAEARDLAEENHQQWVKEERARLETHEAELYETAADLPGFDVFWESVPEFGKRRDRIAMLENFIANHSNNIPQE